MVFATLGFGGAILAEAGLSFLGFGLAPPTPSWGQMLSGAATGSNLYIAPWLTIFPGLAISLTIFAINMLGDGLRDELDPRLRGSR
jgi:peptide/nickel transport system permease protein